MKCPHCDYIDGSYWDDNDEYKTVDGEYGDFWRLPVKMERQEMADYHSDGRKQIPLVACPSCTKTFIHEF